MSDPTTEDRLSQALRERDRLRALIRAVVAMRANDPSPPYHCPLSCDGTRINVDGPGVTPHAPGCPWPALAAEAEVGP